MTVDQIQNVVSLVSVADTSKLSGNTIEKSRLILESVGAFDVLAGELKKRDLKSTNELFDRYDEKLPENKEE